VVDLHDISINRDPTELRKMLDYLGIAAFVIDVVSVDEFRLAAINARHEQLTGMKNSDVAGRSVDELLSPEMAAEVKSRYRRCVESKSASDYQETLELPAGTTFWQTSIVPFFDDAGNVVRLLGTANEISNQVRLELEARYQSMVMSAYLDESPDGILVVDANNEMKTWNRRFLEIWDIPDAVMIAGDGDAALRAVEQQLEDPDVFFERVKELYESMDEEEHGVRIKMKDGRILERHSRGLHGSDGDYWGRIWFYRDVTELHHFTEKLLHLSQTDSLTGIANRRALIEALEKEYSRARRHGYALSILMLDLDHFKMVNDRYGHAAGDTVLSEFVQIIAPEIRDSDYFGRLGGEEFAILLPECSLGSAQQLAERIRRAVAAHTFRSSQARFNVTMSIGVATLIDDDARPDHVLNRADRCLYAAKSEGRNCVRPLDGSDHCENGDSAVE
jgi:diguanylate cyclase (GGDEF)-like protein/PAS domain S-box-containing protein